MEGARRGPTPDEASAPGPSTSRDASARTDPPVAGPSGVRPRQRRQASREDEECAEPPVRRRSRRTKRTATRVSTRIKRAHSPDADSSSDTGDDDYSVGPDECCIYTYRGGEHLAELHSSFYSLDVGPAAEPHLPAPPLFGPRQEPPHEERAPSSPDMDYLEMDFDPGPSCEVDSADDSISEPDMDAASDGALFVEENAPRAEESVERDSERSVDDRDVVVSVCLERDNAPSTSLTLHNGRCYHNSNCHDAPVFADADSPGSSAGFARDDSYISNVKKSNSPIEFSMEETVKTPVDVRLYGSLIPHTKPSGEVVYVRRTTLGWPAREIHSHHNGSGDLVSPGESCEGDLPDCFFWAGVGGAFSDRVGPLEASRINHASALFHCTMAKRLVLEKQAVKFLRDCDTSNIDGTGLDGIVEPPIVSRCMIWTEQEACCRQITQIGTSACGATAVMNALLALKRDIDVELITSAVCTRLRANNAPLCKYIVSRAIAGCNVDGLAAGLRAGSKGAVTSRFFSTWPERAVSLSHWLAYWIELGGVPILTLNLQSNVADAFNIPDSWHHQMVFGVSPRGIYMVNPLECVEEGALWHQLCSDSVLLVKRKDILSRWNRDTDLTPLMHVPGDERWRTMNVLGQVVSMLRESQNTNSTIYTCHIRIPACYNAGITIAVLTGSEAHKRLLQSPELPLLIPEDE